MKTLSIGFAGIALAFFAFVAQASGGKVTGAGGATLDRAGQGWSLNTDAIVLSGDFIKTLDTGRVQWTMMDDSSFALMGDSQFRIDQFSTNPKSGKALYDLKKGGVRTVSGLIGKRPGDEYMMKTPVADIEIMGTIYTAILCQGGCAKYIPEAAERAKVQDGLYVRVEEGSVKLTNGKGSIVVGKGQVGFVAADGSAPTMAGAEVAAAIAASTQSSFDLPLPSISVGLPSINPSVSADVNTTARIEPPNLPNAPSSPTPACPTGTAGTPPNCTPTPVACPGGNGTQPNCAPAICTPPQTGTPPNCQNPPSAS